MIGFLNETSCSALYLAKAFVEMLGKAKVFVWNTWVEPVLVLKTLNFSQGVYEILRWNELMISGI